MNDQEALAFVENHGIVTESARSAIPSLAEAVAGGPISGSWWAHPRHREIFRHTRVARNSSDILVCRLAAGKVTYVDSRLWPYLVRLESEFDPGRLAAIRESHTPSGRHVVVETPFPEWVPAHVALQAQKLNLDEARVALKPVLPDRPKKSR